MTEKEYRKWIESDEAVDKILKHGEEVEMKVAPKEEREVRITVRLKSDEVKIVDALAEALGVGRSTAMKIALRMAAGGLAISSRAKEEGSLLARLTEQTGSLGHREAATALG